MKTLAALLAVALTFTAPAFLPAEEPAKLGLAERRAIKQYQETKWPGLKKAIDEAAGGSIEVEVKWDSIAMPGEADRYQEDGYWTNIYFTPLIEALKTITADKEGRESFAAKVKKIVIFGDKTAPASNYINGVKVADGTLSINFRPWANEADVKDRMEAIKKTLENAL